MSRSERELIGDALEHLRVLHTHIDRADLADETVADAVSLRLASAIESLALLSDASRARLFGDRWRAMWATRNRIAHGYAFVDIAIVRRSVAEDVPALEESLRREFELRAR